MHTGSAKLSSTIFKEHTDRRRSHQFKALQAIVSVLVVDLIPGHSKLVHNSLDAFLLFEPFGYCNTLRWVFCHTCVSIDMHADLSKLAAQRFIVSVALVAK